jgi:hypothetical protein
LAHWLLTLCALASGAALLGAIFLRLPLSVSLAACGGAAGTLAILTWRRVRPQARPLLSRRAMAGGGAGLIGTMAYDLARLGVVTAFGLHVQPYATWPLFGALILGGAAPAWAAAGVGTAYHYLNGVAFGVGYGILLGGRGWKSGVLWALGLEAAMLAVYPLWLDLQAIMAEFTVMSLGGHLVYGTVLGALTRRWSAPS